MKIFITGGTGFIGKRITQTCIDRGYKVSILTRQAVKISDLPADVNIIKGNSVEPGIWQENIASHDAVINLAGASIFRYWNNTGRQQIITSRLKTTTNIVNALNSRSDHKITFLSVSGVGYYGFSGDEIRTEESPAGRDFLAALAAKWESIALQAGKNGTQVVLCRFGHVLGLDGGMLPYLIRLTRLHLGSHWGNGTQWFSWIHINDLVAIIMFLLDCPTLEGAVNISSPNPVQNHELFKQLRETLDVSAILPSIPAALIHIFSGEFASVVLNGQRAIPSVLQRLCYTFQYPALAGALSDLITK